MLYLSVHGFSTSNDFQMFSLVKYTHSDRNRTRLFYKNQIISCKG